MINICCMSANVLMLACNWVMYLNTQSDISVVLRESHSSHMYTANIPVDLFCTCTISQSCSTDLRIFRYRKHYISTSKQNGSSCGP